MVVDEIHSLRWMATTKLVLTTCFMMFIEEPDGVCDESPHGTQV